MTSPYKILVVDDEKSIRKSLGGLLQDNGYEVVTAGSGLECLQIMSAQDFDLVILDIVMPEMSGIEVLQWIKEKYKNTGVIIITGYADKEKAIAAFRLGAYDFIEKPFESREILNTITHCLNQMELRKEVERKTKELAFEKERLLVTLFSIGDGVIATDTEGKILLINKVAEELTDWIQEEAVGKHYSEVFHIINEKTRKVPEDPIARVIKTGLIVGLANHTVLITKDGTERALADSGSPIRDEDGNIIGVVLVFRDVTERRKAEEALRESEDRFRCLVETSSDWIWEIDHNGIYTYASPKVKELLGYEPEEVIGKAPFYFMPQEEAERVAKIFWTIQKSREPFAVLENVNLSKDGRRVVLETSGVPIFDASGIFKGYRGIDRDITERKRAEDERIKLEAQLLQAQKMEAVGTLTGGIAHEFNNMLTTIIGYGKLLQEEMSKDDPLRHNVDMILASSERAANLILSLLTFSREQIIKPMPVNLHEIIKKVEKLLLRVIGEDIELKVILNPPSPPFDKGGQGGIEDLVVNVDSSQIEQVLINLAANARDAMPDGGQLTISTGLVKLDREFLKTHDYGKPGRYAFISITDTGTGMDEKTRERIFEPFFTTKEVGKGTGLGLSMVYGIIKQHNGYINVYSESGKGTTFKIYLPMVKSAVKEIRPSTVTIPTGGTETILLAEDNEEVRKLTKDILQKFGYKVLEAVDGEDVIKKFIEDKDVIQLLILDVIMPKRGGKEAYDEIKKIRPDIKALFMSGYTSDIIHKKGVFEEGIHLISKPLSPRELLKRVREILDK